MIIKREARKIKGDRYATKSFWYIYPQNNREFIYLIYKEFTCIKYNKHSYIKSCWILG